MSPAFRKLFEKLRFRKRPVKEETTIRLEDLKTNYKATFVTNKGLRITGRYRGHTAMKVFIELPHEKVTSIPISRLKKVHQK